MQIFAAYMYGWGQPDNVIVGVGKSEVKEWARSSLPGVEQIDLLQITVEQAVERIEAGQALFDSTQVWRPRLLKQYPELVKLWAAYDVRINAAIREESELKES